VLGHEITHVSNGDMVTLALIQGVVNTFVIVLSRIVGNIVDRAVFRSDRGQGPGYFISVIVAQLVFGVLASIIVLWFSRQREFRADQRRRAACRNQQHDRGARASEGSHEEPLPAQLEAFGIATEKVSTGFARLFMSHPPLDERIAALRTAALA
jgi:heat shock protein HtpX